MTFARVFLFSLAASAMPSAFGAQLIDLDAPSGPTAKAATSGRICQTNDALDGITFTWCIERGSTVDRTKILYFLHGAGANEKQMIDSAWYAQIKQKWTAAKVTPPIVVAVTFGTRWTLSDLPSSYVTTHPALFDFFTNRLMPYVEGKIATTNLLTAAENTAYPLRVTRRLLMGASMGSYNSALLMTRRGDLFKKVVLGCPGLFTTVTPFSTADEIQSYAARTNAIPSVVTGGLSILGADESAGNVSDWERNNPLSLVTQLGATSPALFVWYNDADQFGFGEGASEFSSSAALLGVPVVPPLHNAGTHCQLDAAILTKLASFVQ
jgi:S-formylglutathione hydrolase FrmB